MGWGFVSWGRFRGKGIRLVIFDWFIVIAIWWFCWVPYICRGTSIPHHRFSSWKGTWFQDVCSRLVRRGIRKWLGFRLLPLTTRKVTKFIISYLFNMRRISLHSFLNFVTEQLRWCDSEFLTLFPINSEKLFGWVIVILDLFFRSHVTI